MNPTDPFSDPPSHSDAIGDENVARLMTEAYDPEPLDPEFAQRVRQRAESAAAQRRLANIERPPSPRSLYPAPWLMLAVTALVLLVAAGYLFVRFSAEQPDPRGYYIDGQLVWIDGRAFRPAGQAGARTAVAATAPGAPEATSPDHHAPPRHIDFTGLTPRPRPTTSGPPPLAVGDVIVTRHGQRERATLPDGSVLYVNQGTQVKIQDERRVEVSAGEIFVDVSPAAKHRNMKFVVQTPGREVTATGTKFAVHVTGSATDVAVAQGKVNVSGVEPTLRAGQQLHLSRSAAANVPITPLPRASHVWQWTRDLMAAAESPLVPGSKHRGGALVAIDPQGQQAKLSLRNYHVDVHIEDGFARTTIDQTYFNHLNSRLEGTFYFPLPADASISRLAMYVNGKLMEGGMAERDHARNVFETIKHRSLDPALLEWIDGSTFKMRVFPLEGRQEKRIVLSYTQRLENHYGRLYYRFPAGKALDVVRDWSVRLHVVGGAGRRWECSSHDLAATTQAGALTLTLAEKEVAPDRDVVLALFEEASADTANERRTKNLLDDDFQGDNALAGPRARFSTIDQDGARYTMLRFRPDLPAVERRPRRDWIFLFDADGSRDPLLARVQVDIIKTLLDNAEHDDTFTVITAATRVHTIAAQPQPVTDDAIAAAVAALDQTHLIGALDLQQALGTCRETARGLDNPVLVHVGSAIPILGERATDQLVKQIPPATHYIGVGVGRRWNRTFMHAAASRTGGYFTQINPDETVGWRAFELLATLNSPRLLDLRVTADVAETVFFNHRDSVADGEEICAILRQDAGQPKFNAVTVTGSLDGAPFRQTIPMEQVADNAAYLPRIWAKLAIDDMLVRGAETHRAEIVQLSKAMYVMSPFTSLLVLENDTMYEQYHVDRGRRDHWALYPCPAEIEVVHEPLAGPAQVPPATVPDHDAQPTSKPSFQEILQTLRFRTTESGNAPRRDETPARFQWGFGKQSASQWVGDTEIDAKGAGSGRLATSANDLFGDPFATNPFGAPITTPPENPFGAGLLNRPIRRESAAPAGSAFLRDAIGNDPASLMLLAAPRIIIPEEEEELLGIELDWSANGGAANADFDELIQLITSAIQPDAWDEVGGPGTVDAFPTQLSLVISQTQSIDDPPGLATGFLNTRVYSVGDLVTPVISDGAVAFTAASSVPSLHNPFADAAALQDPTWDVWEALTRRRRNYASVDLAAPISAADARLRGKLAKQASLNYRNEPLEKVIDDIAEQHGIPIVINTRALEAFGMGADQPVTIHLNGVTLHAGIRRMLDELDLTCIVRDEVVQVTTPAQLQRDLFPRAYWRHEPLLMIPRRSVSDEARLANERQQTTARIATSHRPREVDRLAGQFRQRGQNALAAANLLYPADIGAANGDATCALVAFARGITTMRADVLAVLEQEAERAPQPRVGQCDDEALTLIDRARREGWLHIARHDNAGRIRWQMTIDGQGRFCQQQQTEFGLAETVVCDGETLRHLYPELGLGASRRVSRFHRADLARCVPWLVPPAEDMTLGADLRLVGPRMIAIAPHGLEDARDAQGEPRRYYRVHLEFSDSGRLAARHLVEMPTGKIVVRVTYDDAGTIRWFDAGNNLQHETSFAIEPASAPNLQPDVTDLVLLPMPIRTRAHASHLATSHLSTDQASSIGAADALRAIIEDDGRAHKDDPARWSEADVLRLLAAIQGQDAAETRDVIGRRFFAQGDRRLGFYTLLVAAGQLWEVDNRVALSDGTVTRMSPLADHPDAALARFLDGQLRGVPFSPQPANGIPIASDSIGKDDNAVQRNHFLTQLGDYQRLCLAWHPTRFLPLDASARQQQLDDVFDFIQRCDRPIFAFTLLRLVQRQYGPDQPHRQIAEALSNLELCGMSSYVIKYELARSLAARGRRSDAQRLFMEVYRDALEAGIVPPIDQDFRTALRQRTGRFWDSEDSGKAFGGFMRGACAELVRRDHREAAIALAWQCRQLGDAKLADKLIELVLTGIPDHRRLETSLAALDYLVAAGQHQRAVALLQPLLASGPNARSPELWRLASDIAHAGGMLARSIDSLERAADLEFAILPARYNLEAVRQTYRQLLARHEELATIIAVDSPDDPSLNLAARVVQAADRWRSLEADVTAACEQAARLLSQLGQDELAWDYLTTPLAAKPNEATAWLSIAHSLRDQDRIELADRAYMAAWEAEQTNASILWEHAQMLEHAGHLPRAHACYQQLADGDWQPRFRPIQGRAARILRAAER